MDFVIAEMDAARRLHAILKDDPETDSCASCLLIEPDEKTILGKSVRRFVDKPFDANKLFSIVSDVMDEPRQKT